MKIAGVILLPLLAMAAMTFEIREPLSGNDRSIAGICVDILYFIRDQMPCGFPKYNIPPLAPLEIKHKVLKINTDNLDLEFEVKDFMLHGLNDFEILTFKVNPVRGKMDFTMKWRKMQVNTWYRLKVTTSKGLKLDIETSGNAVISGDDFHIKGEIRYSLGLNGGEVIVEQILAYPTVGPIVSQIEGLSSNRFVNNMINSIIAEWISIAVNDYSEDIAQVINNNLVPILNNAINGRTLEQIIKDIQGNINNNSKDLPAECTVVVPPIPKIALVEEIVIE